MKTSYVLTVACATVLFSSQCLAQSMLTVKERAVRPVVAEAQPAAQPRTASQQRMIDRRQLYQSRVRPLAINRDALRAQLQDLKWKDYGAEAPSRPPQIQLPDREPVTMRDARVIRTGVDSVVLAGKTDCGDEESLIFVSNDKVLGGQIIVDGRHFEIRPNPDAVDGDEDQFTYTETGKWEFHNEAESHAIDTVRVRRSPSFFGRLRDFFFRGPEEDADDTTVVASRDESGSDEPVDTPIDTVEYKSDEDFTIHPQIEVMVVYSKSLEDIVPHAAVGTEIGLAIQQTNFVYELSGIDQRLHLAHWQAVDYTPSGNIDEDLEALVDGGSGLEGIHALWRGHEADIVSLWVGESDYPGVAYRMTNVDTSFAACAANVVRWPDAINNYSFAHELGHNMGANHDEHQTSSKLPHTYAHGYVFWQLATIMAYPEGSCDFHNCDRIPVFSNAEKGFGEATTADNSRTLNETAATVAAFDTRYELLGSCPHGD